METPGVTALVVTYSSRDTVGAALAALRPARARGWLRVVVVDNASADGTADVVEREHPWAGLVRSPRNLGYGRGCNLGFSRVETPYVLVMNPDVVLEPEAVRAMALFLEERPRAGIVAPSTRLPDGGFQRIGGRSTPWRHILFALGLRDARSELRPGDPPRRTDWLCGAVFLIRSGLFRSLGGFDPRYFLYFEETDLFLRAEKAGWQLWALGSAVASHAPGSSARKVDPALKGGDCLPLHFFPSRFYYWRKHFGLGPALAAETVDLGTKAARDLGRRLLGRPPRRELGFRLQAPLFAGPPPVPREDARP
jgi:hypothetical protein